MALVKRVDTVKCAPGMAGFCSARNLLFGIAFVTGLIITLSAPDGLAAPIAIANPGFESDPAPAPSDITAGVPTGWSAHNSNSTPNVFFGSLYAAPNNYPGGAPEGNHVGVNFISANRPAGEEFGMFQTLSAA